MRVLVTGGTGFIGCHTAAALVGHGHQVRLLVRARERVASALGPLGIADVDTVVGSITDPAAVEQAVRQCEAVVHAASVVSFDSRRVAVMAQTNPTGTDLVLGAACRHGLDPIVHVSTLGVFLPPTVSRLTADAPLGIGIGPYTRSKIAAERIARGYQQAGAPLVITYPAGVLGPHDPHLGDTVEGVRDLLRWRWPVLPRGRLALVDVRDVAALHTAVLHPGRGARRYLLGGPAIELVDLVRLLGELTGRQFPQTTAPDWVVRSGGRLVDWGQRLIPARLPISAELLALALDVSADVVVDDTPTRRELTVQRRELAETLADTVSWLAKQGHVTAQQAGTLLA